ncbi:MAG: hypothetical protein A4S16_12885 [Proteobacteria bacterium SG_bin6]|uniref:DUF2274 domain-containing protein n=1 Tax=Erythrobacter colymbi TaxID=1161202 RepID=UPI000A0C0B6A|nr:DUF2274 domain-containing protein [Erythrobacter colymbi]OQW45530.1 MAG: hypothetical protein A4S16_12885 [Proteobacteria bacterium SG_bin6]
MTRLKLTDLADEKPVRLTLELPARLHRDLIAYALAVNGGDPKGAPTVERLVPPMLERFIATDRGFAKGRRNSQAG